MADSSPRAPIPGWVTFLDALTCVLALLAVNAFVTGTGPHGHIAGIRISLTSELRLGIGAACAALVRYLAFRRPTLLERLRPFGPAVVRAVGSFLQSDRPFGSPSETRTGRWVWPALVVALFCVPLFVGLGNADVQNDEAIYSFAADTMAHSGDFLTPRSIPSETEPFLEKPPLKFWIVAGSIRLGLLPDNEFGMRLWDAVFGAAAFLYVFAIGRRLAGPVCGFVAVFVLFAEPPLVFDHGLRTNHMEAPLFLSYCAGIYHFLAWRSAEGRRRYGHVLALALYFVLGFMTKFVAALFLPAVLGTAALVGGDWRRLWRDRGAWVGAAAVAAALIAPWFVYQHQRNDGYFWHVIFGQHVFTRFTASLDPTHVQPWYYYFSELSGHLGYDGSAPMVRAGLALLLLRAFRPRRTEAAILLWAVLPLVLISAGTSKLYHYTYPFLPALALAAGYCAAVLLALLSWALAQPWARLQRVSVGRLTLALRVAAIALIVYLLPSPAWYYRELTRLSSEPHPLRSLRDCLQPVAARFAGSDGRGPGVWIADSDMTWPLCYYLRGLGPWDKQDAGPDAAAYTHLYAPGKLRPVILSYPRYDSFMRRVRAQDRTLVEEVARDTGQTAAVLNASASGSAVARVRFSDGVLLLPGPYAGCAAVAH